MRCGLLIVANISDSLNILFVYDSFFLIFACCDCCHLTNKVAYNVVCVFSLFIVSEFL